jgi:hypothetical protein
MAIQVEMEKWPPADVSSWLRQECKIGPDQAEVFVEQKIDGEVLPLLTEDRLTTHPFHLTIGEALKIIAKVQKLQGLGKFVVIFLQMYARWLQHACDLCMCARGCSLTCVCACMCVCVCANAAMIVSFCVSVCLCADAAMVFDCLRIL